MSEKRSGRWLYAVCRFLLRIVVFLCCRCSVSGLERVPREGPLLVIGNHPSWYDPLLLGALFPRRVWFFTKHSLFRWPIAGWLASKTGQIPVARGESDRRALDLALAYLREDRPLVIFPEGTARQETMIAAHTGAAMLALRSGATVLPVAFSGTGQLLHRRAGWRPWVRVQIGEPYTPVLLAGIARKEALRKTADQMMFHIAEMLPPLERGVYARVGD